MADSKHAEDRSPGGLVPSTVPVPDPTKLTTDATNKLEAQLRREQESMQRLLEARLDAMDKATILRLETMNAGIKDSKQMHIDILEEADQRIGRLREVQEEKIRGINTRITERDNRLDQMQRDNKESISAALTAQKELAEKQNAFIASSNAKSETVSSEAIKQQGALINGVQSTMMDKFDQQQQFIGQIKDNFDDKIDGVKELVNVATGLINVAAGSRTGQKVEQSSQQTALGNTISIVSAAISVLTLIAFIIFALVNKHQ